MQWGYFTSLLLQSIDSVNDDGIVAGAVVPPSSAWFLRHSGV